MGSQCPRRGLPKAYRGSPLLLAAPSFVWASEAFLGRPVHAEKSGTHSTISLPPEVPLFLPTTLTFMAPANPGCPTRFHGRNLPVSSF